VHFHVVRALGAVTSGVPAGGTAAVEACAELLAVSPSMPDAPARTASASTPRLLIEVTHLCAASQLRIASHAGSAGDSAANGSCGVAPTRLLLVQPLAPVAGKSADDRTRAAANTASRHVELTRTRHMR
jgi:hypothetical protein